jgi:hypothetical protein
MIPRGGGGKCAEIVPMCGDFHPHPSRPAEHREGKPATRWCRHETPPASPPPTRSGAIMPAPTTPTPAPAPAPLIDARGICTTGVRPHSCTAASAPARAARRRARMGSDAAHASLRTPSPAPAPP